MTSLLVMGAGLIGLRHISAIKHSPDCQLAGVIEPNSDLHTDPEIRYFPSIDSVDVAAERAPSPHRSSDRTCEDAMHCRASDFRRPEMTAWKTAPAQALPRVGHTTTRVI